jgi:hypothetical protein
MTKAMALPASAMAFPVDGKSGLPPSTTGTSLRASAENANTMLVPDTNAAGATSRRTILVWHVIPILP